MIWHQILLTVNFIKSVHKLHPLNIFLKILYTKSIEISDSSHRFRPSITYIYRCHDFQLLHKRMHTSAWSNASKYPFKIQISTVRRSCVQSCLYLDRCETSTFHMNQLARASRKPSCATDPRNASPWSRNFPSFGGGPRVRCRELRGTRAPSAKSRGGERPESRQAK